MATVRSSTLVDLLKLSNAERLELCLQLEQTQNTKVVQFELKESQDVQFLYYFQNLTESQKNIIVSLMGIMVGSVDVNKAKLPCDEESAESKDAEAK